MHIKSDDFVRMASLVFDIIGIAAPDFFHRLRGWDQTHNSTNPALRNLRLFSHWMFLQWTPIFITLTGAEDAMEESSLVEKGMPMDQMVQPLVKAGITVVPPRFIQPAESRPGPPVEANGSQIPVIDMSGLYDERRNQVLAEIAHACQEWGFFQVRDSVYIFSYFGFLHQFFDEKSSE